MSTGCGALNREPEPGREPPSRVRLYPCRMAVVIATSLRKEIAGSTLFDGVSFTLRRGERVALAGPNGAGKTTLLRMISGETDRTGGDLAVQKGARIGLHDQRPPALSDIRLRDYAVAGAAGLAAEQELRRLEAAMEAGDHGARTLRAYAEAQARLEHAGGYAWRERVSSVLRGLGFRDGDLGRPLSSFSGGELTRASLARVLATDPDVLLLDEPTNHLDVESLEWLEEELSTLDAAVMLVAHDRWFLEASATAVLELESGRSTFFSGPWHAWRREKAERTLHAQKTEARLADDLARLERFVERFRYRKSKARQAQAKLTQISRLETERRAAAGEIALLTRRTKRLGFEFLQPPRSGRTVVEAEGLELRAGDKQLLDGVTFAIERGEHVALVGPNGSGKTTLLETILGLREPASGRVRLGHGVVPAYFSQHGAELPGHGSALAYAQEATGLQRPQAQALLGRFLFSGWEAHEKPVGALSGGERRRLALAVLVASGANFLVLDEPTNHLDLESREALEVALDAFPGTVLLVSHDRALVDAVAARTLAIEARGVRSSDGGWAELVRRRAEENELTLQAAPDRVKGSQRAGRSERAVGEESRKPGGELQRIEMEIAAREQRIAELEQALAADWGDVDLIASHRRARDELKELLARWEELFEETQARL
jgi:ATP-binding cassette, subfamily F, member 3